MKEPPPQQAFATPGEAVQKAKADFLEVLASGRDLNLGVDAATLKRAQAGAFVPRVEVDFGKLLAAEPATTFASLALEERNAVVPLVADGKVVTIVEIVRSPNGWRVVGLADRTIADALTAVHQAAGDSAITLYEVPNLQTRVYAAQRGATEMLFTDYKGRFTMKQAVRASALIPVLKADALDFQRQYGDSLKRGRLVR